MSIKMVEQAGVKLHFVKPMSILDKNLKLTVGKLICAPLNTKNSTYWK